MHSSTIAQRASISRPSVNGRRRAHSDAGQYDCLRGRLPAGRGLSKRHLNRILEFIQDHLSSDLSPAEFSEVIGVSASHLKAQFKESTGTFVHQFIVKRRVDYAVELLSSGKRRLSEVALQAGFADQSHMARCMRRVIGMTPSSVIARY